MAEICSNNGYYQRCQLIARTQDAIGWWHFMEGMGYKEIRVIQTAYAAVNGSRTSAEMWTVELITNRLLEVTHGQWLYRNIQVHDKVAGMLATLRNEEIQMEIGEKQALGQVCLLVWCTHGWIKNLQKATSFLSFILCYKVTVESLFYLE
jgi:hypothetical protein